MVRNGLIEEWQYSAAARYCYYRSVGAKWLVRIQHVRNMWCDIGRISISFRTKTRVAWTVVLYFSNRASTCSHALIFLRQTRWIVMIGWRTSISLQPFTKHFWIAAFVYYKHRLHRVFRTRLECGSLSAYTHKHVWIMVLCWSTSIFFLFLWSNMFGCRFFVVCKHLSPPVSQTQLD